MTACCSCSGAPDVIDVYMPDGAPALSMARLMHEDDIDGVEYHVVDPSLITTTVTGGSPLADVCILPLNNATKLLGTAEVYGLLGTVTHGNLYILSKEDITLTRDNISILLGERVGVLKLNAVPGLTFKTILKDLSIPYREVTSADSLDVGAVNLQNIDATQVGMLEDVNYYLLAEPAVSIKCKTPMGMHVVGSLQDLYGEGGYPQAVIVAKLSLLNDESTRRTIRLILDSINPDVSWVKQNIALASDAIRAHLPLDYTPSVKANFVDAHTIDRCSIRYVDADVDVLNAFLTKLNAVSTSPWGEVNESFIYEL